MERITIIRRTVKRDGRIRLRFRLQEGRTVQIYHRSSIQADLSDLDKFTNEGRPKPKARLYNRDLADAIMREIAIMRMAYKEMKNRGLEACSRNFEGIVAQLGLPFLKTGWNRQTLLSRFKKYVADSFRDGLIGDGRSRHYLVTEKEIARFLALNGLQNVTPTEFTPDMLIGYWRFLIRGNGFAQQAESLQDHPKKKRSLNTIAGKMKQLQAFFRELEDKDEIQKSPFRLLGKARKIMMKEKYGHPVFLTRDELFKIMETDVPVDLQETKDAFLLQCAFGCRIGDFKRFTMANILVSDEGIPYIHYLPQKTRNTQRSYDEVETPVMLQALKIIKRYDFHFPILKKANYVYNKSIKSLLKYCGIGRRIKCFDAELDDNITKPLYEFGSTKLCRKTHIDMMSKVQVDLYVAGLHKKGSKAIHRYTKMGIKDLFNLMCVAFQQPIYKVDTNLNVIQEETI